MRYLILLIIVILCIQCKNKNLSNTQPLAQQTIVENIKLSKADSIINKTIEVHGGKLYNSASYSFLFRGNKYSFKNEGNNYTYTTEKTVDNKLIFDELHNGKFQRKIDKEITPLSEKQKSACANALNSVMYFSLIPYKLNDKSVNKEYIGETIIKNKNYHTIKVAFDEDGGGKDFKDEFLYWINASDFTLDYFAYKYDVDGGGIRFRSFFNRRNIDGIIFQDYINWKPTSDIALNNLQELFENNALKKVSLIENTIITNLK